MVSESSVIKTNSVCVCGNGDTEKAQSNIFENKCAYCGQEGTLSVLTESNVDLGTESEDTTNTDNTGTYRVKIRCKNCGSEYCGQDGYDMLGGTRGTLTTVSPYDVTSDDDEVSSTDEGETTYMSGWEGLCDLLKPLDGEAMMVQRGDYVFVNKIEMPQTARLWVYEGINIVHDSVTVTDYTPEIYNTFTVKWGESFENELEFVFEKHRKLFGERRLVVEAKKISAVSDTEQNDNSSENNDNSSENNNNSSENNEEVVSDATPLNVDGDESSVSGDSESSETEEVPIVDRDEAIQFGLTQVGKAKREDGHQIELKVIGNSLWRMGEWCHVKIPSFNEDSYMFISKCNGESSGDSEYINSLTLVDYPPSLGKPKKVNKDSEDTSDDNSTSANNDDVNVDNSNANTNTNTNTNTDGSNESNGN